MGKASREHRQAVIEGREKPHGIIARVKGYVQENKEAIQKQVLERSASQIFMEAEKLVKQDIKKGKVKDIEIYVKETMESLSSGKEIGVLGQKISAMSMLKKAGVTLEEMEALIRQTLKENYAGKI